MEEGVDLVEEVEEENLCWDEAEPWALRSSSPLVFAPLMLLCGCQKCYPSTETRNRYLITYEYSSNFYAHLLYVSFCRHQLCAPLTNAPS